MIDTPGGIVLCGGESRRMRREKASLPFGSETMLGRVVRLLAGVAKPIVVVAAEGQIVPSLPAEVHIVRDPVSRRGPWQGIAAGLRALANVEFAYVCGCDGPFLEPGWVRLLLDLIGAHDCAVPFVDDRWQPLAGLYRVTITPTIERLLDEGKAPLSLFELAGTRRVTAAELQAVDPDLRTLRNLNTWDDYQDALRAME